MTSKYAKVEAENYCWWRALAQYWVIYFLLYPFFKIFYRIKVYGRENIPKDRSIIIAANHMSYFDPVIVSLAAKRPIAFMAKEELFSVPVISQIIQILGAIAVNREKLEIATIRSAKAVLTTKWFLGIFPEGTRIRTGKIGDVTRGFGYLAKSTNSEILPLGIVGSDTFCGKLIVRIGKPIPVPENPEDAVNQWGRAISELTGLEYQPTEEPAQA
ncbi:MAG: lysophospholipid acyltransferase family protein [Candidatus Gastranaerophilales bacterium]|nr:lysophospholipid acyltransferase family protein [Candidatus Gastranaerophilales bacterium]